MALSFYYMLIYLGMSKQPDPAESSIVGYLILVLVAFVLLRPIGIKIVY